jgi:hypothetical protein
LCFESEERKNQRQPQADGKPLHTPWYLGIFSLAELIFGASMWLVLRANLYDIADANLKDQAADLGRSLEAHPDASLAELQVELSEDYKIEPSEDYLQIIHADGNVLYRSRSLEENPLPPFPANQSGRPRYENHKLGHRRFRFISEQTQVNGQIYNAQLGHPPARRDGNAR